MYQSPLNNLNMGPHDHEETDVTMCVTIFNALGIIEGMDEVCICAIGMLDMNTLPEGGYITALEVPLHPH